MSVVDPRPFLKEIDYEFFEQYKAGTLQTFPEIQYTEPTLSALGLSNQKIPLNDDAKNENKLSLGINAHQLPNIKSKIARLGDFIDTDAVRKILTLSILESKDQRHCMMHKADPTNVACTRISIDQLHH